MILFIGNIRLQACYCESFPFYKYRFSNVNTKVFPLTSFAIHGIELCKSCANQRLLFTLVPWSVGISDAKSTTSFTQNVSNMYISLKLLNISNQSLCRAQLKLLGRSGLDTSTWVSYIMH